jgi:TfoX/Sxy family transcriptional regulator of competence genes
LADVSQFLPGRRQKGQNERMEQVRVPKPTDADRDWFVELLPSDPDVVKRPMFGNVAGFVNGNMFMTLFGPSIALRLDPDGRSELLGEGGTEFAPMAGRPMKEYVVLPAAARDDLALAAVWVARSLQFVRTFPPKQPKKAADKKR